MPLPQNPIATQSKCLLSDPSPDGLAFTGAADVTLPMHSRGIYIAADGDLKIDFVGIDGATGATGITFVGVKGGTVLPIRISKIYDTGTTTSGVILY